VSGPPYPHPIFVPGSNAIGSFTIGVSPIGTITIFDIWTTVISQYANSPILSQLCTDMGQYFDQTVDFDSFYDTIWNVDTAIGYGLDVWGRIVGVGRVLHVASPGRYFGFEEAGGSEDGFNQSPFFTGQTLTDNFYLSDDAFRILIFAKALSNICDGSIKAINQLLLNLFPNRGNAYVVDNLDMTMVYTFEFSLTPVEAAIMAQSGVLPNPVGVGTSIVQSV
jgi:hypothetical protein